MMVITYIIKLVDQSCISIAKNILEIVMDIMILLVLYTHDILWIYIHTRHANNMSDHVGNRTYDLCDT